MIETIRLLVEKDAHGAPVYEEVRAERCGPNTYRLGQSPGLLLGIAAGDVFTRFDDGRFSVVERSGNLCIQIFSTVQLDAIEKDADTLLRPLGGHLDGRASKELVYTVPLTSGFELIEAALSSLALKFPNLEWYYGNVYDPTDGVTPLNWWTSKHET